MFLVESLFCWLFFFPSQSLIKKVLICSIYFQNNKNLECGHTPKKKVEAAKHIPFQYFVWKSIGLKLFQAFGRIFVLLAVFFPSQSLIKTVFICSIHLLNNKNLECGHNSKKGPRCQTHVSTYSFSVYCWKKYCFESVSCFWSNLCLAGCFFCLQRLIQKVLICSIYLQNNKNLECGHTSKI